MFSADTMSAIRETSRDVASELIDADAEIVAEVTLDANRLTLFGHPQADQEVSDLITTKGYQAVLSAAAEIVYVY